MSWSDAFTRATGIELPVVQAPMAGQGLRLLRRGPTADLLRELTREAEAAIAALSARALP
ncbi:MAG TPA: hypothetical protein VHL59_00385 [Thermoanaerobaculia bacterium]|nr:hypothetical protein [Thermoanaerobaculia bacterium]